MKRIKEILFVVGIVVLAGCGFGKRTEVIYPDGSRRVGYTIYERDLKSLYDYYDYYHADNLCAALIAKCKICDSYLTYPDPAGFDDMEYGQKCADDELKTHLGINHKIFKFKEVQ